MRQPWSAPMCASAMHLHTLARPIASMHALCLLHAISHLLYTLLPTCLRVSSCHVMCLATPSIGPQASHSQAPVNDPLEYLHKHSIQSLMTSQVTRGPPRSHSSSPHGNKASLLWFSFFLGPFSREGVYYSRIS